MWQNGGRLKHSGKTYGLFPGGYSANLICARFQMRLDRFIESALRCSARTARALIAERKVLLNAVCVVDSRHEISKFCRVEADGKILQDREPIYLLMHKPKGCVSATSDTQHRTVLDLLDLPGKEELHLAGRLDFNTTGLLLLTNDGAWSQKIMHPLRKMPKTYRVETDREITPEYTQKFAEGLYFRYENLTTLPAQLTILSSNTAEITIHEGRYHQIKRMFGFFQNKVTALHRISIGEIVLDESLPVGASRHLTAHEIASV
jgi:16S rRNA pseudouridine516 synthase